MHDKFVVPVAIMLPDLKPGSDPVIAIFDFVARAMRATLVQMRSPLATATATDAPVQVPASAELAKAKTKRVRSWKPAIVEALRRGPLSKSDLANTIGCKPSNLASTLSRLAQKKAITVRKKGGRVLYGLPTER